MKVNVERISEFASGGCGGEVVEGAWRPVRMPASMRPLYEASESAALRMSCPAGVRLRFESDTTRLRVSLHFGHGARPIFTSVLLVDDEPAIPFGPDQRQATWSATVFEQNEAQRRRFELWLPHMACVDVVSLEVDDGCHLEPAAPLPIRWLAYGDSIMQGMTATQPHLTCFGRCLRALEAEGLNVAVGGAVLEAGLAETVPPERYDLVSIAYGTNDYSTGVPTETFQHNAKRLIEALLEQQPDRPIVLITPLHRLDEQNAHAIGRTLDDYRQAMRELAGPREQVHLVAGETLMPAEPRWFVDGVHPNDAGFQVCAQRLLPHLQAALRLPGRRPPAGRSAR